MYRYQVQLDAGVEVKFSTCSADTHFDTDITLTTSCSSLNTTSSCLSYDDDGCNAGPPAMAGGSTVSHTATFQETVFVSVGGYMAASGQFELVMKCYAGGVLIQNNST